MVRETFLNHVINNKSHAEERALSQNEWKILRLQELFIQQRKSLHDPTSPEYKDSTILESTNIWRSRPVAKALQPDNPQMSDDLFMFDS